MAIQSCGSCPHGPRKRRAADEIEDEITPGSAALGVGEEEEQRESTHGFMRKVKPLFKQSTGGGMDAAWACCRQRRGRLPHARIGVAPCIPQPLCIQETKFPRDESASRACKSLRAAGHATRALAASTHDKGARESVAGPRARCRQAGQALADAKQAKHLDFWVHYEAVRCSLVWLRKLAAP